MFNQYPVNFIAVLTTNSGLFGTANIFQGAQYQLEENLNNLNTSLYGFKNMTWITPKSGMYLFTVRARFTSDQNAYMRTLNIVGGSSVNGQGTYSSTWSPSTPGTQRDAEVVAVKRCVEGDIVYATYSTVGQGSDSVYAGSVFSGVYLGS